MKFKLIFLTEIITIFLIVLGVFPLEAALFLTGAIIFYIIFSPLKDGLVLTITSIPLYVALPVTESFNSMANWRVILTVLFLTLFFRQRMKLSRAHKALCASTKFRLTKYFSILERLVGVFLAIGVLSLINATDITAGIKRLLFFVNIFLLYIVIRNVASDKTTIIRLLKAGAVAGIISIVVGYAQFISIFFISLYRFWTWWATHVISLFYGQGLANLLGYSNTWFSYYPNKPPTLRMFSIFPDSHSFALFSILAIISFLTLAYYHKLKKDKKLFITHCSLLIASLLAIILSGSRGVWISGGGTIIIVGAFYLFTYIRKRLTFIRETKIILATFIIFILLFPVSSLILGFSQRTEGVLEAGKDSFLIFERAKSSIDIGETSVRSRWDIWKATLASIKKHPLLGVGIGNYPVVLEEDISAAKRGASAHNLYMDVASEMGILGLVILALIFWQILKTSWFTFRDSEDKLYKFFTCAFGVYFLWVLGYSLFDVVLLNDKVLMFFVVVVGILYSISALERKNRLEEVSPGR